MGNNREYKQKWYQQNKQRIAEKRKQEYDENKEYYRNRVKEYYQKYPDLKKISNKKSYEKHKKSRLIVHKEYVENNKEKIAAYKKNWANENKEHLNEYRKRYYEKNRKKTFQKFKERCDKDSAYKLKILIRKNISKAFRTRGFEKPNNTTKILGCTFQEFKEHIEHKFQPWMNWDNYGLYNGTPNYGWDIDHIIPLSSSTTIEDIIALNHYSNLQPLCSFINRDVKPWH